MVKNKPRILYDLFPLFRNIIVIRIIILDETVDSGRPHLSPWRHMAVARRSSTPQGPPMSGHGDCHGLGMEVFTCLRRSWWWTHGVKAWGPQRWLNSREDWILVLTRSCGTAMVVLVEVRMEDWGPIRTKSSESESGLASTSSHARGLPPRDPLRFWIPSSYSPQIRAIGQACGLPWASPDCWCGTLEGDRRSFACVVKTKQAPIVMVNLRGPRRWGELVLVVDE
jgi:hypothetical protein